MMPRTLAKAVQIAVRWGLGARGALKTKKPRPGRSRERGSA